MQPQPSKLLSVMWHLISRALVKTLELDTNPTPNLELERLKLSLCVQNLIKNTISLVLVLEGPGQRGQAGLQGRNSELFIPVLISICKP